ncbi:Flp family type IVb pilin [Croceicoccus gelatinilyticus]|uniref:Flp family type IVb pilin n=1 Tax=Croceicoccus gelatinilyticus TaxID=2835536 RepID=UPI001CEDEDD2|nr:Flp family type IVb pilin [Croceicoccus gelatinilyticus]
MKTFIKNFVADEAGASAAEYALIIAVVGVGIGAAALVLGANVKQAVDGASTDVFNCNTTAASSVTATPTSTGSECVGGAAAAS